jgi:dsRNA-specific ribonuclease
MDTKILTEEEKLVKMQQNQEEMLTPHYGIRGNEFKNFIENILINRGKVRKEYIYKILNDENMEIYNKAFTSKTIKSYKNEVEESNELGQNIIKTYVVPDENSPFNNTVYKIIGEGVINNFFVFYVKKRFPFLNTASSVRTITLLKHNYNSKKYKNILAEKLNIAPFINSSTYEFNNSKFKLLDEIYSSFFGATEYIFDKEFMNGIGYIICYDILKSLYDEIDIEITPDSEDLGDPKTLIKELFQQHKNIGVLLYETVQDKHRNVFKSIVYRVVNGKGPTKTEDGTKIFLAEAESQYKKEAEKDASSIALQILNKMGYYNIKKIRVETNPDKINIIYGDRTYRFKNFISNLLNKGDIKEKYKNILSTNSSLQIYNDAFTSNSANLDENLAQNKNSKDNYEVFEILGDGVFDNFISSYIVNRFPELQTPKDENVLYKMKSNYRSKNVFSSTAESLGFLPFITASVYQHNTGRKNILEDTFEAFFGATASILDNNVKNGIGYSVCYDILKSIYDEKKITADIESLIDPFSVLKEFFEKNKNLGIIVEDWSIDIVGDMKYHVCTLYRKFEDKLIFLGKGSGSKRASAKVHAATNAVNNLKKEGYVLSSDKSIVDTKTVPIIEQTFIQTNIRPVENVSGK